MNWYIIVFTSHQSGITQVLAQCCKDDCGRHLCWNLSIYSPICPITTVLGDACWFQVSLYWLLIVENSEWAQDQSYKSCRGDMWSSRQLCSIAGSKCQGVWRQQSAVRNPRLHLVRREKMTHTTPCVTSLQGIAEPISVRLHGQLIASNIS